MRPYLVAQGDHLSKLAAQFGFDADSVWNHPKNDAIRQTRANDPHLLRPGDLLHLPEQKREWFPVKAGASSVFVAPARLVSIAVRFLVGSKPLAGEAYVVDGAAVAPGTLDGAGYFRAQISARLEALTIQFPARNEHYALQVGHLDPADSAVGLRRRLGMLGFYGRGTASCADEDGDLAFGVRHFQSVAGLPMTGRADEVTVAKVKEMFGR